MVQRAAASQERINEFLQTKTDIISRKHIEKPIEGDLRFDQVRFVYPDSGIMALEDISFGVKAGQSIALLGTTGSGKSTVATLLCRMYDTTEGQIQVDGIDIRDYSLSSLRSQIGYVPQDVSCFQKPSGIILPLHFWHDGRKNHSGRERRRSVRNIQTFPEGFETKLGERGITLSGGQKQRVSIARAIVREPRILILDDALSAVDTKTENVILTNLKRIMQDRTSIIYLTPGIFCETCRPHSGSRRWQNCRARNPRIPAGAEWRL